MKPETHATLYAPVHRSGQRALPLATMTEANLWIMQQLNADEYRVELVKGGDEIVPGTNVTPNLKAHADSTDEAGAIPTIVGLEQQMESHIDALKEARRLAEGYHGTPLPGCREIAEFNSVGDREWGD